MLIGTIFDNLKNNFKDVINALEKDPASAIETGVPTQLYQ